MREFYSTLVNVRILHGDVVLTCPCCKTDRGLTVAGYLGDPATIICPRGTKFRPPSPFDPVAVLHRISTGETRQTTHLFIR